MKTVRGLGYGAVLNYQELIAGEWVPLAIEQLKQYEASRVVIYWNPRGSEENVED